MLPHSVQHRDPRKFNSGIFPQDPSQMAVLIIEVEGGAGLGQFYAHHQSLHHSPPSPTWPLANVTTQGLILVIEAAGSWSRLISDP